MPSVTTAPPASTERVWCMICSGSQPQTDAALQTMLETNDASFGDTQPSNGGGGLWFECLPCLIRTGQIRLEDTEHRSL